MFSDVHEDKMSYENSSDSDSKHGSTTSLYETHFLQPSFTSTNLDSINMSNINATSSTSNVAERVWEALDFMSTMDMDLTGFLDALNWGDTRAGTHFSRVISCI